MRNSGLAQESQGIVFTKLQPQLAVGASYNFSESLEKNWDEEVSAPLGARCRFQLEPFAQLPNLDHSVWSCPASVPASVFPPPPRTPLAQPAV